MFGFFFQNAHSHIHIFYVYPEPLMTRFTDACKTPLNYASIVTTIKPTGLFIGTKHKREEQGDES